MKLKKSFFACLALALACMFVIPLAACNNTEAELNKTELNIVDDNYRNGYEIFVRSFYDSGEDGIGDLKGVTHQLDYIKDMGYNLIWLMPIMESTTYHGYDVVDYYTVEKDYGTNEDFQELTREAHARGINVIIDMVINHSSTSNAWFKKATKAIKENDTTSEDAKYRDYYTFKQFSSNPDESIWRDVPGATGWYYEGRFDNIMPDLNLDSQTVKDEIENIFEYWLNDMGCDGFRLDAVTSYYTGNVPKNIEFLTWVNDTAKSIKEDAYIVGEAWEGTDKQIREYYNSGCDSFFLFTMSAGASGSSSIKKILSPLYSNPGDKLTDLLLDLQSTYNTGILAPFLGNHDTLRAANMLGSESQIKIGAGIMSIMNGTVWVYYGDEIGMTCASSQDETKRIPMKWSDNDVAVGQVFVPPMQGMRVDQKSYSFGSVEEQAQEPNSILNYYKEAMRIRNCHPEIARGEIEALESVSPYIAAIKKTWNGNSIVILVNMSSEESFNVPISNYGKKVTDTLNVYDASSVKGGTLTLQPYSIAVIV